MFRVYSWLDLASALSEIPGSTAHARAQPDHSQTMWMTANSRGVKFLAFSKPAPVVASYAWNVVQDITLASLPDRKGVKREMLLLTLVVPPETRSELQAAGGSTDRRVTTLTSSPVSGRSRPIRVASR